MPPASIIVPAGVVGAPEATETMLPARTTIEPRSITEPFAAMMRAFVIVRSCAEREALTAKTSQNSVIRMRRFIRALPSRKITVLPKPTFLHAYWRATDTWHQLETLFRSQWATEARPL